MSIRGYKELSAQIAALGAAAGGSVLRSAARAAMKEAQDEAERSAPVAAPPYTYEDGRSVDPYPRKTYKGRLVTPGFTKRSIVRVVSLSKDKNSVRVALGVRREAFYAIQFIEFGTSKIPKRPWLEPAFRRSIPRVDRALLLLLRKRLDAAVRRKNRGIALELGTHLL